VDSVSNEIKEYHADDLRRDNFYKKQAKQRQERFSKQMAESIHGMKQMMGKVDTFQPNPMFHTPSVEGPYHVEAAKETVSKQTLLGKAKKLEIAKKKKEKDKKVKAKKESDEKFKASEKARTTKTGKQELGESSRVDPKAAFEHNLLNIQEKHSSEHTVSTTKGPAVLTQQSSSLVELKKQEKTAQLAALHKIVQDKVATNKKEFKHAEAVLARAKQIKKHDKQEEHKEELAVDSAKAEVEGMKVKLAKEKSAKMAEKSVLVQEEKHKQFQYGRIEKNAKGYLKMVKSYRSRARKMEMQYKVAKGTSAESTSKLKANSKLEQLSERERKTRKTSTAKSAADNHSILQKQAKAALKQLKAARSAAYKAQRKAALMAKKAARLTSTKALTAQSYADADANRQRLKYLTVKSQTNALLREMPLAHGASADIAAAKKKGAAAKAKAKMADAKAKAESQSCKILRKEAQKLCNKQQKLKKKLSAKPTSKSKQKKQKGKQTAKKGTQLGQSEKGKPAQKKKLSKGKTAKTALKKATKDTKKLCDQAQAKAQKACKNAKGAKAAASASDHKALKRAAYVAQMKAAQVALKEAKGEATPKDVKRADDKAARMKLKAAKKAWCFKRQKRPKWQTIYKSANPKHSKDRGEGTNCKETQNWKGKG